LKSVTLFRRDSGLSADLKPDIFITTYIKNVFYPDLEREVVIFSLSKKKKTLASGFY